MPFKKAFIIVLAGIAFFTLRVTAAQEADINRLKEAPYQPAELVGVVLDPSIDEASGLAASCKNKDVLWVINDGGNPPALYAVSPDGETVSEFTIEDAQNIDWEDMASFRQDNHDFLMVADVGDNDASREFCSLYVVEEPDIREFSSKKGNSLNLSWQMKFRYEDGPRDCEAVAVDSQKHKVLLLSKRTKPPVLCELPLEEGPSDSIFIARPVAGLVNIPPPIRDDLIGRYGRHISRPTAMDLSRDGKTLVILTYGDAYYYRRGPDQEWKDVFAEKPQVIPLPDPDKGDLIQREAICINNLTGEIFITSEHTPAPIYGLKPLAKKTGSEPSKQD